MRRRGFISVVFGGFAVAVMVAGAAWACTESADLTTVGQTSGTAGAPVTVRGTFFNDDRVDVRWGDTSGPVVASGQGPDFTVTFNVPAGAAAGVHYIVGTQAGSRNPATPFKVIGAQATAPPDPPSSPAPSAVAPSSPQEQPAAESAAPVAEPVTPAEGAPAAASAPSSPPAALGSSSGAAGRLTVDRRTAQAPAAVATPAAPAQVPTASRPAAQPASSEQSSPASSARSLADDVWSGFTSAGARRAGPSLDTAPVARDGASSVPALAAVLLTLGVAGLGLVGLGGALGARRRRSRALID